MKTLRSDGCGRDSAELRGLAAKILAREKAIWQSEVDEDPDALGESLDEDFAKTPI